ncbi:MAG: hypothetical protein JSS02_13715 [Planctomycetes bacterium]|nr:hypothetical protein [Planctomycetota bacterium]
MNDMMIFVVGLGVMGLVMASSFVALIASDDPERIPVRPQPVRPIPVSDTDRVPQSVGAAILPAAAS